MENASDYKFKFKTQLFVNSQGTVTYVTTGSVFYNGNEIANGAVIKYHKDQHVKRLAKKYCLDRALRKSNLDKEERGYVWAAFLSKYGV